jgi:hypothetical protein
VANYLDLSSSLIHWNPSLLGLHMIRNWNLLTHSLVSYIPQSCIQGKWTTCCGLPLVARKSYYTLLQLEVFGRSRRLLALLSFCGQQHLIEFSLWILLERGAFL